MTPAQPAATSPVTAPRTLVGALRLQAQIRPEATAFIHLEDGDARESRITFEALHQRALGIAASLGAFIRPGDRVMLVLPPGLGYLGGVFGCLYAGAIAVPVYPPDVAAIEQSLAMIKAVATDAAIRAVLTVAPLKALLESLLGSLAGASGGSEAAITVLAIEALPLPPDVASGIAQDVAGVAIEEDALAVLLYTSGSTGAPKGVMLSHGNFLHNARITNLEYGLAPGDVLCTWVPPYHVSGLFSGIFLPVALGCVSVSFSPLLFLESPIRWLRAIERYGAVASGCPTFAYDLCCAAISSEDIASLDLRKWRVSLVGGESVRRESLERFAARFQPAGLSAATLSPMYGLTESTMICTAGALSGFPMIRRLDRAALQEGRSADADEDDGAPVFTVSSGHALGDLDVRVVDPVTARPCEDDTIGEVWVAGGSVAKGYWNRPADTESTFGARIHTDDGALLFASYLRTGDLGYLHEGQLFITGRLKELIIVRGLKYYPEDLEKTVASVEPRLARSACAAFACETEGEERLYLAIEMGELGERVNVVDPAALDHLAGDIRRAVTRSHGVVIAGFVFVGPREIPRTKTGKIQRRACAAKVKDGEWKVAALASPSRSIHVADSANAEATDARRQLVGLPPENRLARLTEIVFGEIAGLLPRSSEAAPEPIRGDRSIAELGLDSILVVTLSMRLRAALQIEIPIARLFQDLRLDAFVHELFDELQGKAAPIAATDFARETTLDESIAPPPGSRSIYRAAPAHEAVLLTGATGFLGSALLGQLLARSSAKIYCLVRAASPVEGKRRLRAALARAEEKLHSEFEDRVIAVSGELTLPGFGLPDSQLDELGQAIDTIYHNGAAVNFVASYAMLKSANVSAVVEVMKLACRKRLKAVHFISSLAVFNSSERWGRKVLREGDRFGEPEKLFGGYAQSKWVAEALLQEGSERGIPITIHRPGFIAGDSRTGFAPTEDFLSRFLKGGVQLGALPDLPLPLDLVPVDYVAESVVRLAQSPDAAGKTFHFCNPSPLAFSAVLDWIAKSGRPIEAVPIDRFVRELCAKLTADNALYPLVPFLTESMTRDGLTFLAIFARQDAPIIDCRATLAGLAASGASARPCPPVDDKLLSTYFDYFERSGFLARPRPASSPRALASAI